MIALLYRALDVDRRFKRWLQILLDFVLVALSLGIAVALRPEAPALTGPQAVFLFVAVATTATLVFAHYGLYRAIMRYITGSALRSIVPGVAASGAGLALALVAVGEPMPLSLVVNYCLVLIFAVGGTRLFLRWLFRFPFRLGRQPAIIYGAGGAGQQLVAALLQASDYVPVAFVDDEISLHGATLNGVQVHSSRNLKVLIDKWRVREVLIAMPSITRTRRRKIVARLEAIGVQVKTIPSVTDVVRGKARLSDLCPVTPEDLLGRDPVAPKPELMQKTLTGKVVMVTGAGGSIGSELCRQIILQKPKTLVLLDIAEYALYAISIELRDQLEGQKNAPSLVPVLGSVQNPGRMRTIMRRFGIQTIYHAAAYKHVNLVEENVIEGIYNNVFGTKVIAEQAVAEGVENFILISTDKTVRPANVMGASKRLAELICQAHAAQTDQTIFSMVRFGNVLGSSGSVIPRFRDQIERGGPVTVTHPDVMRYFMTIPEAAELVIQAGAMAKGGDVFVLDMGKLVKILDLAKSMIRLHGLTPFVIDQSGRMLDEPGDIAIQITGLSKGEKLFEELMIGRFSRPTVHPRILTASEVALESVALAALLDDLFAACESFDLQHIQSILRAAPLEYTVNDERIHDLMWQEHEIVPLPAEKKREQNAGVKIGSVANV